MSAIRQHLFQHFQALNQNNGGLADHDAYDDLADHWKKLALTLFERGAMQEGLEIVSFLRENLPHFITLGDKSKFDQYTNLALGKMESPKPQKQKIT